MALSGDTQHDSYMQLDMDGDFMQIQNKLPLPNKYILAADENWINKEMQ